MTYSPLPFPAKLPNGYRDIEDDETYAPDRHLQLEFPERTWTLQEFGYSQSEVDKCASNVAVTSPYRVLSDEGVTALHRIVSNLKSECTHLEGKRVPTHLAGGVYRSKFLRDFCACPVILQHLSKISGTTLSPHSLPSQQLYVNYAPPDISKAVDAWHHDGIGFDYVLMLSDPSTMKGGNFEYYQGTKAEIAALFDLQVHQVRYGITEDLPDDKVIKTNFPAAGYAIFQQGDMVVHRAARLLEPADRITMVPGFVSLDTIDNDPTAKHDIVNYAEPGVESELARHSAWLARNKLQRFIDQVDFTDDSQKISSVLESAVQDVQESIEYLQRNIH